MQITEMQKCDFKLLIGADLYFLAIPHQQMALCFGIKLTAEQNPDWCKWIINDTLPLLLLMH